MGRFLTCLCIELNFCHHKLGLNPSLKFSVIFHQISSGFLLTLSWRRPISYRNQSADLLCKSMDWFLYDDGLQHEGVNQIISEALNSADVIKGSSKSCWLATLFFKFFTNLKISLREMCPNTELFLVRIFLCLNWIQQNTDQK